MTRRTAPRGAGAWLVLLAAALLMLVSAPAHAEEDARIAHAESDGEQLRLLVDVPAAAEVDLRDVRVNLAGEQLAATAALTDGGSEISRTAVLAIDTSRSMRRHGRFQAALDAAETYLSNVPSDVAVGIVSYDSFVRVVLSPTTDREAARLALGELELARQTLLYDGLVQAVEVAGEVGQRSVLVLSDGADTGSIASLRDVIGAVTDAQVHVDAVALDLGPRRQAQLRRIAAAGSGQVLATDSAGLARIFEAEAQALADQVLITAPLPDGFTATEATIAVTLATATGTVTASAFVSIREAGPAASPPAQRADRGWNAPGWLFPVAIGLFALGAFGLAFGMVPGKPQPMTIAERVHRYTSAEGQASQQAPSPTPAGEPVLDQAKAAVGDMLRRNQSLESRIERQLAAAGSGFKPGEWLLLHIGVVVAAGVVGLLIGRGSILLGVLFLAIGLTIPPVWLRWQASRQRKAFQAGLPEILQLMSGALSAGLSLAQAVDTIVREGPEPIASEFKRVLVENRIGMSLEDAFDGVAARYESRDFAWVVMAIRIQREVGGNLAELLTTVAETMRERKFLRRQVQTLAAEGKLSAMVLCGLPPAFFLFVLLTRPEYMTPMLGELLGWLMLGGATLWLGLGVFWMSRVVKIEV